VFSVSLRNRGWAIIAADLVIILGVYFIFTHYRSQKFDMQPVKTEVEVERAGITYSLKVNRESEDRLRFIFGLENKTKNEKQIRLDDGVELFLTDYKDAMYRPDAFLKNQTIRIYPGEKRTWQKDFLYPQDPPNKLYGAFYIDDNRKGRVDVP
jgi:hypothetical protein